MYCAIERRSLPHRQLRKEEDGVFIIVSGSLPHRQLRKMVAPSPPVAYCSLPHRQLRKFARAFLSVL